MTELEQLHRALARSQALAGLAADRAALPGLLERALKVAADLADVTAAAAYVATAGVPHWTLLAHLGPDVPDQRDPLADPPEGRRGLPLQDDQGVVLGVLEVDHSALTEDDERFLAELAGVVAVQLARDHAVQDLVRRERRLVEAQRISHVGSYDFEIATNTNVWSDQLYRIYGREPQSFNASYERFLEMLVPEDREHVMAVHQRSLETLKPFEMEERITWPNGQVRTLSSWGEVVTDDDGRPARMVGICWDITERKLMEEQLIREALHDRLTGLPNRALLVDRLTQTLGSLGRRRGPLGVLFVDVDRFKVINDSLGHDAGDEVLIELGRRFSGLMRPGDTVARFGGDEFVVLCADLAHAGQALAIAERLQQEASHPLSVRGTDLVVTVSTGIALTSSPDTLPTDLLRDADAAMYRAKHGGRARSVVFADEMRDEAMGRLDTEMALRKAITEEQLRLHYQPIVDLESGRITGVEALVRWLHPTRGLVPPGEFIPIAEETGLIIPLGEWVLDTACAQLADWQQRYPGAALVMAVNLSGLQLGQPDVVARVADSLQRSGADPRRVALEITESVLMRDAEDTLAVLHGLRRLGVRLHVDDFGTGYSSLSYLKRFPVDALKIDQSFVAGLGRDAGDRAIVHAVLALADALGMATVAEGVETAGQLAVLRELGAATGQGFLFGRPVPADELEPLLERGLLVGAVPRARSAAGT